MINNKYLCDYTINIPIFTDDPTNKNICQYLLKEHRNIIIYCNSQKEGKNMNELLNKLQNKSSEYIDCNTSKLKRKAIIDNFKSGELPFLVNVKILVEGFDAPITKGVCFMHLPSSKTTLIQIIGRALRLHKDKTFAKIILPFSSKEDETSIVNFMKVMAKNDYRIKKSFESKKVGGYISIENIHEDDNETNNEESNDINFKYELIFDSMGVMNNNYNQELWERRLEELKKYIDENGKLPTEYNNYLYRWLKIHKLYYKQKLYIMSIYEVYFKWTEFINDDKYKKYFISNEDIWKNKLEDLKKYIDINNKIPSHIDKNKDIVKLYNWFRCQKIRYKTKNRIMSNPKIYKIFTEFIDKYNIYFLTSEELWCYNLSKLKEYIDCNNKKPSKNETNNEIQKLYCWVVTQKTTYKLKKHIMSNPIVYKKWEEFISDVKYKTYFISNEDIWYNNLNIFKKYLDENKKIPLITDINKDVKIIASWCCAQKTAYTLKNNIMTNPVINKTYQEFINNEKYKKYFMSNEDEWFVNFKKLKIYIDTYNKTPSATDTNNEIKKLGYWKNTQKTKYNTRTQIMSNIIIYKQWNEFINDEKYKKFFISNEDAWYNNFNILKIYIDENKKTPSCNDKNNNINKLTNWLHTQLHNYKKTIKIMAIPSIYNQWTIFINDEKYKKYFN